MAEKNKSGMMAFYTVAIVISAIALALVQFYHEQFWSHKH